MRAHGWCAVVYNRRGHALAERVSKAGARSSKGGEVELRGLDSPQEAESPPPEAIPAGESAPTFTKTWALYCDVLDMAEVRGRLGEGWTEAL